MNYAKVENGEIVSTELPETGELPDGRMVSNFDKLPPEILKEAGWLPIETPNPPKHNANTHEAREVSLKFVKGKVIREWSVTPINEEDSRLVAQTDDTPSLDERIAALELAVKALQENT